MSAEQGTEEWLRERSGHATASCFADVLARGKKGGESASRRNYRTKLVTERLIGTYVDGYRNAAMDWGNKIEPAARAEIEAQTGLVVERAPFIKHGKIPWCGASPDGLIGDDGVVQIKCPYVSTVHVKTLEDGLPSEHIAQIQGELWVTGRAWSLFSSYDPRMPPHLRLHTEKVPRDNEYIKELEEEVLEFLREVDALYDRLMKRAG